MCGGGGGVLCLIRSRGVSRVCVGAVESWKKSVISEKFL